MGLRLNTFLIILLGGFLNNLKAQESVDGPIIGCEAGEYKEVAAVFDPNFNIKKAKTASRSSFEVDYTGFTSEAKAAFQSAINVWESYLVSRVPIKVTARYESINSTTLANSGSKKVFKNFTPSAIKDVWYPSALANAIAGNDIDPKETDIVITVNKNISWSFKTDGTKDNFKYDLKTVILHELAHGLGFTTTFKIAGTNLLQVQWGLEGLPLIYDVYIQNEKGAILTDNSKFGNPSADLKTGTTSGKTFFKVDKGVYKTDPPKMYAPSEFRSGGSISHLDEGKYPKGTENSMMSPQIGSGEINHIPGQVILAILNQIGWPIVGFDGQVITATEPTVSKVILFPNPSAEELQILAPMDFSEKIEAKVFNSNGLLVKTQTLDFGLATNPKINIRSLSSGIYILNLGELGSFRFVKD
jgi:Secretion system C-terminal sorting domain